MIESGNSEDIHAIELSLIAGGIEVALKRLSLKPTRRGLAVQWVGRQARYQPERHHKCEIEHGDQYASLHFADYFRDQGKALPREAQNALHWGPLIC